MNNKKSLVIVSLSLILILSLGFVSAGLFNKKVNYVVDITGDAVVQPGEISIMPVLAGGISRSDCLAKGGSVGSCPHSDKGCCSHGGKRQIIKAVAPTISISQANEFTTLGVSCTKYCNAAFGSGCSYRDSHGDGIVEFGCSDGSTAWVYLKGASPDEVSADTDAYIATDWYDRDGPGGSGDYETLKDLINEGKDVCQDSKITLVECQTKAGVDYSEIGEVVTCRKDVGAVCRNKDQSDEKCNDYKIRFYCEAESTTSAVTLPVEKVTSEDITNAKYGYQASGLFEGCVLSCANDLSCEAGCRYALVTKLQSVNSELPICYGEAGGIINCELNPNMNECEKVNSCSWGIPSELYLKFLKEAADSSISVEETCTETDGGLDYNSYGIISGVSSTGNSFQDKDTCGYSGNANALYEYYCDGKTKKYSITTCENGCVGGACVSTVVSEVTEIVVKDVTYSGEEVVDLEGNKIAELTGYSKNYVYAEGFCQLVKGCVGVDVDSLKLSTDSQKACRCDDSWGCEGESCWPDNKYFTEVTCTSCRQEVSSQIQIPFTNQTQEQTEETQEQVEQIASQPNSLCLGSSCKLFKDENITTVYSGKLLDFEIKYLDSSSVILKYNGKDLSALQSKQAITFEGINLELNEIGSDYAIFTLSSGVCIGCSLNNKCYNVGYRTSSRYCADNGNFIGLKPQGITCDNSFECDSQICIDTCIDKGQWENFLDRFKTLFRS
jgi:Mucin-2 protein WxxW repeating region